MSNIVHLRPDRPTELPADELLKSAAKLLRVSAATFADGDEPWHTTSLEDVHEVVSIAIERVNSWLDQHRSDDDPTAVYDAQDVLTLIDVALAAGLDPRSAKTSCPFAGAMRVAAALLEESAS